MAVKPKFHTPKFCLQLGVLLKTQLKRAIFTGLLVLAFAGLGGVRVIGGPPPASSPPPSMTWAAQESSASIHPGWQHPRRRRRQRPCPPKEHEEMTKNAARLPKQPPDDPPRGSASPRQRLHGTVQTVLGEAGQSGRHPVGAGADAGQPDAT